MRHFVLTLACAAALASPAAAQTYPDPATTAVNDSANMIDEETEARIVQALTDLRDQTGTEMSVATLSSVQFYANDQSVVTYATELFNAWGIGDQEDGDGILLLVFRDDNQLKLELGAGYGTDYTDAARAVVDDVIVPAFRDGHFAQGIEAGTLATIETIANPFKGIGTATTPSQPQEGGGSNMLWYILGGIGAAIAGVVGLNRRSAAKLAATPCPSCGKTGLTKDYTVLTPATLEAEGEAENRTSCPHCDWSEAEKRTLSKLKPAEEDKFSGGKSDGEGAAGKW